MNLRKRLVQDLIVRHPLDAGRVLESLAATELAAFVADSDPQQAKEVLALVSPLCAAQAMAELDGEVVAALIRVLSIDDQVAILYRMPQPVQRQILDSLPQKNARVLQKLLQYPHESAATLVETQSLRLSIELNAGQALDLCRRSAQPIRYYVYVCDSAERLCGVVTLRELMRAAPRAALSHVMQTEVVSLPVTATFSEILSDPNWRRYHTLPVVDDDRRFIGVIRHETLQALRQDLEKRPPGDGIVDTITALSELYWLGLNTAFGGTPETDHSEETHER